MALSAEHQARLAEYEAEHRRTLDLIEAGLVGGDSWQAAAIAVHEHLADYVPPMLYRLWRDGRVDDERLREVIADVWIHNRSPVHGLGVEEPGLGPRRWLEMFKAVGFVWRTEEVVDSRDGPVDAAYDHLTDVPTKPMDLWRGAALSTNGRGMSWSIHRDCAREFAQGWADLWGSPTGVYCAEAVPPRAFLALFSNASEQEAVLNPNMLRGRISLVEEVAPVPFDTARFDVVVRSRKPEEADGS